ncbi:MULTISPECIES: hypothetical protein [Lactococcus]|uniref:hypothetical protein n=1 Tax=Lactococcus TaxID=1357 RepID=UPI001A8C8A20|nr:MULTISPECIES: hypothetical protein [Lactococcus]MCH1713883.1 hypothetical protein [Lactococcus petauri]MDG6172256.1 hypothetical protein [Lactococcus formosensis]QSR03253.1 hypothetical protein J0J33_05600 [Lactococcus sp. LG1267]QSR11364.1 hypothetical protein JZX84_03330 [Lactococcus sp. LG592]
MKTIIKNKKIAIIIAIVVVLGAILLGVYRQSVNRYSSKIAVQIDNVEKLSENKFAPENHVNDYGQWIVLSKNANNKSNLFQMIKMTREYDKKFSKDESEAKKNEKTITDEVNNKWSNIYIQAMLKASQSESYGNRITKVWRDAIYENYATVNGKHYTDFKDAVNAFQTQYSNEFSELNSFFQDNIDSAHDLSELIRKYFPEKSNRADDLEDFAQNVFNFNDEAINPSGSYSTRASKLSELDTKALSSSQAVGMKF